MINRSEKMVEIVFSNKKPRRGEAKAVLAYGRIDKKYLGGFLSSDEIGLLNTAAVAENFDGKNGKILSVTTLGGKLVCIGVPAKPTTVDLQKAGGILYGCLKKYPSAVVYAEKPSGSKFKSAEIAYNLAFGFELSSYSFDKYLTKRKPEEFPKLESVSFAGKGKVIDKNGYVPYSALAAGVRYARDLTNEPSNNMTPVIMAEDIKRLEYLGLEIDVLDEKAMKEKEFNLALSVAQGSCNPPRIAVIKWRGNPESKDYALGLVGKGVTFDSGGISLKPAGGMADMKQDMAGAAAVVGAMKTAALQKLTLNVVAVVGLVENMPSGSATRPGDIVRSMSGQTVEILNTDAEGRLVLADCLWYIQQQFEVKKVIDIATLTGAIMVALGTEMAGIMGNNQAFIETIGKAGAAVDEKVWQLPLSKEYDKMMDSAIADMQNVSAGRNAGSITAACFLQRFIKKDVKWAHLDIAGMDKVEKPKPLTPKGASGFGVRLFNAVMKNL